MILHFPERVHFQIRPQHDAITTAMAQSLLNCDAHFDLVLTAAGSGHEIPEQCLAALEFNALRIAGLAKHLRIKNADGEAACAPAPRSPVSREGQP